jgi:RecB family exonuclease
VLQAASALDARPWYSEDLLDPRRGELPWLVHVASFDAGLRAIDFPASDQEYRLRALLSGPDASEIGADPIYAAGSEAIEMRRSRRFTRFDGNLRGLPVPSPAENVTSATRLEAWATCPFAYLLQHVLSVQSVENPEEELAITPLNQGTLVHDILEEFIEGALSGPPGAGGQPWSAADRARMISTAERVCAEYEARGLTGRPIFWRRDRRRILADLERTLNDDDAFRRAHGTRPIAAELGFGFRNEAIGEVRLSLPDGRSVAFRGRADRVDVATDGTVNVIDYKTGSARRYIGLSQDDPVLGGHKLQLPVYGQAARAYGGDLTAAVRADYWFVSSKGEFKRIGYLVTPTVLDQTGQILGTIVEGIEGGVFPPHPTASSTSPYVECAYCDPDALGVVELQRSWERKKPDPDMAAFVRLIAPDSDTDEQGDSDG